MSAIFTILTVLIVIASVLLVIVVLLQNGKGDGLASNFVAGNQTLGVRQTADILEKFTWGLVTFILVVSIVSSFTLGNSGTSVDITNQIENSTTEQPAFPSAPAQSASPSTPSTDVGQAPASGEATPSQE